MTNLTNDTEEARSCGSELNAGLGAYSNTVLNDNNWDDEIEKLCEIVGIGWQSYERALKKLPDGFHEYPFIGKDGKKAGFSVWIKSKIMPNKGSDFAQALEVGLEAFEFGDCFLLFSFEDVI